MKGILKLFIVLLLNQFCYAQNFLIKHNNKDYQIHEILSQYIQQESISGNEKKAARYHTISVNNPSHTARGGRASREHIA